MFGQIYHLYDIQIVAQIDKFNNLIGITYGKSDNKHVQH